MVNAPASPNVGMDKPWPPPDSHRQALFPVEVRSDENSCRRPRAPTMPAWIAVWSARS